MTHPNAFALKNSDLNAFLFADVGIESNGSTLTILSILARLGQDPWAEAARLAKLPKIEAFESLAGSIGKMQLGQQTATEMGETASRLILLLPAQPARTPWTPSKGSGSPGMPNWLPLLLICACLVFGVVVDMIARPVSTAAPPTPAAPIINRIDPL